MVSNIRPPELDPSRPSRGIIMDFDIECPECGAAVNVTLQDVGERRTVRCRRGHSIKLEDQDGGARKAQEALDDLDRAIKRLGR